MNYIFTNNDDNCFLKTKMQQLNNNPKQRSSYKIAIVLDTLLFLIALLCINIFFSNNTINSLEYDSQIHP